MWLFLIDLADYTAVLLTDIATFPSPRSAACRRYATSTSQKEDRRISETRLSSYLYVFLYNTSSTGV